MGSACAGREVGKMCIRDRAKTEPKVEKEKKPKKHFKFQCPVKIVKDEPEEIEDVECKEVEETEEEN